MFQQFCQITYTNESIGRARPRWTKLKGYIEVTYRGSEEKHLINLAYVRLFRAHTTGPGQREAEQPAVVQFADGREQQLVESYGDIFDRVRTATL